MYNSYKGKPSKKQRLLSYLRDQIEVSRQDAIRILNYSHYPSASRALDELCQSNRIRRYPKNGTEYYALNISEVIIEPKRNDIETIPSWENIDNLGTLAGRFVDIIRFGLDHPNSAEYHEALQFLRDWFYRQEDRLQFIEHLRKLSLDQYGKQELLTIREYLIKEGWITRERFDQPMNSILDALRKAFDPQPPVE